MKLDGTEVCGCGKPAFVGFQGKPVCQACFDAGLRGARQTIDKARELLAGTPGTRLHYFDEDRASADDGMLKLCIRQGYVPSSCLLAGLVVLSEVNRGNDPCAGCEGPRERCHGRPKKSHRG